MKGACLYCDFCRKSQYEARRLLTCGDIAICNDCIEFCSQIVAELDQKETAAKEEKGGNT